MRKLLYLQHFNPGLYPSLEHSSTILAEEGWQVRFFGVGAPGEDNAIDLRPHPNIQVTRMAFVSAGWRQKLHYLLFAMRASWIAATWQPDWIYVSDPFACPVACLLSWSGRRIVYHEHDIPERDAEGWRSAFMRFIYAARLRVARRAAACVVPGEARRAHFLEQTATLSPVFNVWNCPLRREVRADPNTARAAGVALFYHGTIVPSRLPLAVITALARSAPEVTLSFAGYETVGHPGYAATLLDAARKLGIGDRVRYLGAIRQRESLLAACAQAHVGLSFMPIEGGDLNMRSMVGASNKPFDYLAGGVAVLVSDLPDWKAMFVERGYGIACRPDDVDGIAQAIAWIAVHRDDVVAMGERGRRRMLEEWNYETQFEPVARLIHRRPG